MSSDTPTIEQKKDEISRFMGYEKVCVGYFESDSETQWQRNNAAWMNKVGITNVGWYAVNVKEDNWVEWKDIKYHESWEQLMPVIIKISKMPLLNANDTPCTDPQDVCYPRTFGMPTEDGKQVMFRFNGFIIHEADTLIEAAHAAVYEVAYFENNQNKNQ
jgi:hypothetical protein